MPVILSCGHEDEYRPIDGWPLQLKDQNREGKPSVSYVNYCRECFIKMINDYPTDIMFEEFEYDLHLKGET